MFSYSLTALLLSVLNPASRSKTVPDGSAGLKKYLCRFCPEAFSYLNIKAEQIT